MAVRDHTGHIRPSIPLDGTFTSWSGGSHPASRPACRRICRRTPTTGIGHT